MTSCDHVVRAVRLHYELRLTIRQYPVKFAGHMPSEGRNTLFLVCHVSHVTTWSEEYVTSWVQSLYHKPATFMVIGFAKEDVLRF